MVAVVFQPCVLVTLANNQMDNYERLVHNGPCGVIDPGVQSPHNLAELTRVGCAHKNRIHIFCLWGGHLNLGGPFHQLHVGGHLKTT